MTLALLEYPPLDLPLPVLFHRLSPGNRRPNRLVLVEDDAAIAVMYRLQLVSDGFDVEIARDGASGLHVVQESSPDLILLDVRLPRMSGLDLLQAVRQDPRLAAIPVLILSNFGESDVMDRGLELGARGYLIKSQTTPVELSAKIRELLPD
jgi:DNA-binding response OmpR family regulator